MTRIPKPEFQKGYMGDTFLIFHHLWGWPTGTEVAIICQKHVKEFNFTPTSFWAFDRARDVEPHILKNINQIGSFPQGSG